MILLSRVAHRMYWLGRYLERAEATARLINACGDVVLEAPQAARRLWPLLLTILNIPAAARRSPHALTQERKITHDLLHDVRQPSSLLSAVSCARENARTAREHLAAEAWEQINDLYWLVKAPPASGSGRQARMRYTQQVIDRCQHISGILHGTLCRDAGYHFVKIGRHLERADMITRSVDFGVVATQPLPKKLADPIAEKQLSASIWLALLRCHSAHQMYRQQVQSVMSAPAVIQFLLTEKKFPRSLAYSLRQIHAGLELLPYPQQPLTVFTKTEANAKNIFHHDKRSDIRKQLDATQLNLVRLNDSIFQQWFVLSRTS